MEQQRDAIGNLLDQTPPLDYPPAICLFGPPGAGKTIEMASAFPNLLYVQTSKTVLQPVASFMHWVQQPGVTDQKIADAGYRPELRHTLKLPNRLVIPKYRPGTSEAQDPRELLKIVTDRFITASIKGENPYDGIVFDEWSEMGHRIQQAIDTDSDFGRDNFKRIKALKELHYQLAWLPRETNKMLGIVCHEMEPVYELDDESPTRGELKHRGGPKMPIKTLVHDVSAAFDVCLRIMVDKPMLPKGKVVRTYQTEVQPDWVCKIRGVGLKPREPLGLRALLTRCGYPMPSVHTDVGAPATDS